MQVDATDAELRAIAELRRLFPVNDYEVETVRTAGGFLNVTLWHRRHDSIPDGEYHIDASGRPKSGHATV